MGKVSDCPEADGARNRVRQRDPMRRKIVALCLFIVLIIVGVALGADIAQRAKSTSNSILLGNSHVGKKVAHEPAGSAQVFPFGTRAAGTATSIRVYVGSINHATKLIAGIYSYGNGSPRQRLAVGTLSRPHGGRWNSVEIRRTRIRPGHRYGIAVLGTGGMLYFRDRINGDCHGADSEQLRTAVLPLSWHGGNRRASCAISAYVVGTRHKSRGSGGNGGGAGPHGLVGTRGAPAPNCSAVVRPGNAPTSVLVNASAGSTVCLANGRWPNGISINRTISKAVTLAAQNPGGAIVNGMNVTGDTNGLTVEGLVMTQGVTLRAQVIENDTFEHLTMEGWGGGDAQLGTAFYSYSGGTGTFSNIRVLYNQIDHVPQCLEDGNGHMSFSHNVCGPDIGNNGSTDVHYIQAEGANNEVVDNNAFEGPPAPGVLSGGSHLNVYHGCGSNLRFDSNIVWHTETAAQDVLWGDDCQVKNSEANNNLIVEDSDGVDTYSLFIANAHGSSGVTFSNNTVINPTQYGAVLSEISRFTAHNNLVQAIHGYGFPGSARNPGCACSNNAANDSSGDVRWAPAWQNTTWTPNDGSPWKPPPANYYKPRGIASTFGYRGNLGP